MEKELNPRQQLKKRIFEAYRNCIDASSPDISKLKGQLWSLIDRWCKKYLFTDEKKNETVDDMGEKILNVIEELIKEDRNIKTFEKPGEFITYLNGCLKNAMTELIYDQLPETVSNARVEKYFYINRYIETRERDGKLSENDRIKIITNYMPIYKYKEIKDNVLNILELDRFTRSDDEDNEISLLNSQNVKSIFNNPESTNKFNVSPEKMREAVMYVLEHKRQKRTKACIRALFTVQCIRGVPNDYLEKLAPVLDSELLHTYRKTGIKPTQDEVYLKYHPVREGSDKNSAEQSASNAMIKFHKDLKIYFEENQT